MLKMQTLIYQSLHDSESLFSLFMNLRRKRKTRNKKKKTDSTKFGLLFIFLYKLNIPKNFQERQTYILTEHGIH